MQKGSGKEKGVIAGSRIATIRRVDMGFRLLTLVRPFLAVLPDVQRADRRVPFKEKAIYTAVALFVFLVCSQLPLYGIKTNAGSDPFYWARVIMASNRGTCMELGISPIVTSGLVMQLLAGSKIIDVDNSVKADRDLLCAPRCSPSPRSQPSLCRWPATAVFLPLSRTRMRRIAMDLLPVHRALRSLLEPNAVHSMFPCHW